MIQPFDIDCPSCGAMPGRFCGDSEVPHDARVNLARQKSQPREIFKQQGDHVVGPGGLALYAPLGFATVGASELNRILAIVADQRLLGDDDGARIVAQEKRERERIEAAKAELAEDLGIEITPLAIAPPGHAPRVELRDGSVPWIIGCTCGWRCTKTGQKDSDDEYAEHAGLEIAKTPPPPARDQRKRYVQTIECAGPGPFRITVGEPGAPATEIEIAEGEYVDVEQDERGKFLRVVGRGDARLRNK